VGFAPKGMDGRYRPCPECWEPVNRRAATCPCCHVGLLEASTEENPYLRAAR
jgi:hypothetical protein